MSHVFGKSITFRFQPLAKNDAVAVDSLVSARIYADAPTVAQIEDAGGGTTGHIQRVTSWTPDENGKLITFSALTDSDPHSTTAFETFHVVVNFKYESTGPEKWLTEVIHVYRPDALTSRVSVEAPDVYALYPRLETLDSLAVINGHIARATKDVFGRYAGLGNERHRMFDLEKLNDTITYRAAALACMAHVVADQAWLTPYGNFQAEYENAFKNAMPGYDLDGDDVPDPSEALQNRVVYSVR